MMDKRLVQIGLHTNERQLNMIGSNNEVADASASTLAPTPLVVHYTLSAASVPLDVKPVRIQVPSPFPYKKSNEVPWNYGCKVLPNDGRNSTKTTYTRDHTSSITNISGVSGLTRSGRCYGSAEIEKQRAEALERQIKGKEKEVIETEESKEEPAAYKRSVSEEEACEFLKLIKQSDYRVIEQLNRTPARISLLSLFLNSEPHRRVLMKVLNQAHVCHDISVEKLGGIVGNIIADNYITFTDDEIPSDGTGHNKALHISVKCKDHVVARVLVDNGSSLNVMPQSTLAQLPVDESYLRPSTMIVRAFDGTRRGVIGDIELPIQVGPTVFNVTFQVMDITPAYSCLLGRPWIHSAGAVPSTLHQKVKFIIEDKLVVVSGEEDLLVTKSSSTPYIEATEEALESAFQTLEIANASYIREGAKMPQPHLPKAPLMVAKVMMKNGFEPGGSLGKQGQGMPRAFSIPKRIERFGVGYKPTKMDWVRTVNEKKEKRMARLGGRKQEDGRIPIPDIKQSFRSGGFIYPSQVLAIEDEEIYAESHTLVYRCPPGFIVNNWDVTEFPVIFNTE